MRVAWVRRDVIECLEAKAQIITPLDTYTPISTFDVADYKKHAPPEIMVHVHSFALRRAEAQAPAIARKIVFLRSVEQLEWKEREPRDRGLLAVVKQFGGAINPEPTEVDIAVETSERDDANEAGVNVEIAGSEARSYQQ